MRAMLLAGLMACATVPGNAQRADTLLKRGARVRAWQAAGNWVKQEGTIVARRGDSLDLSISSRRDFSTQLSQSVYSIKLQDIDSLNVATVEKGQGNWLVGAIIGGGLGYFALAGCQDPPKTFDISHAWDGPSPRCKEWRTFAAIGGGVVGALLTGGKRTRWVPVSTK